MHWPIYGVKPFSFIHAALNVMFVNNSPIIVGRTATVSVSTNKPVQFITCEVLAPNMLPSLPPQDCKYNSNVQLDTNINAHIKKLIFVEYTSAYRIYMNEITFNINFDFTLYICANRRFVRTGTNGFAVFTNMPVGESRIRIIAQLNAERSVIRSNLFLDGTNTSCSPYLVNSLISVARSQATAEFSCTGKPTAFTCLLDGTTNIQKCT